MSLLVWLNILGGLLCVVYIATFIYALHHQDDPFWQSFIHWM